MTTTTKPVKLDEHRLSPDLMLPTDYPLKEALSIYAKRLVALLTAPVMILGIGAVGAWFSILLAPILYFTSSKVRAIINKRLKDSLLSLVVVIVGLFLNSILDLGFFSSLFVYVLMLCAIILIFARK